MNKQPRILIVSEDSSLRSALCEPLESAGYHTVESSGDNEALQHIAGGRINLVICDIELGGMEDLLLLSEARNLKAQLPFVLITTYTSIPKAVTAIKAGASDYITMPFSTDILLETVNRLCSQSVIAQDLVLADIRSQQLAELARRVAQSAATVMITGESGSGKEVFARFIHASSPRSHKPFIAINCAAIPETMLESLLFGYEKGAFTGAVAAKPGKFEQANGGTLLLDEISEMDLGLQAKLLRVIQEKEVERLGGNRPLKLDVRIIATTNRNLKHEVAAGRFREDLYYRLNVFPLALLPLRQRQGDIVSLARTFVERHQGARALGIDEDAMNLLQNHSWPGNVRELENVIQRALILATGDRITAGDLVFESQETADDGANVTVNAIVSAAQTALQSDLKSREQALIFDAISHHSRKHAAELLGISPRTLRYKIAQFRKAGLAIPA
ncbi:MAG TPA: sigma-54 dependent transcriptional regulator [Candidatus Acidoferrum sp.]|nr:sigma-54 dependent transcriptional regulator [Candidatus Acidoferrum sp.]